MPCKRRTRRSMSTITVMVNPPIVAIRQKIAMKAWTISVMTIINEKG